MALLIILIMLFLAVVLTVVYFPRLQKPVYSKKNFHFETAQDLAPNLPKSITVEKFSSPPTRYELPEKYNENQIALLVRDPEWLYAYWEISSATCEHLAETFGNSFFSESTPVLRIFNVTNESLPLFFDVELNEEATRWHIHVNKPNNSFFVAVGRKKLNGEFIAFLFSNVVKTPRTTISTVLDIDWLPYGEEADLIYRNANLLSSFSLLKERED